MGIVSWTWDFGDGGVSHEQNPTHVYLMPGEYNVRLTVEDSSGNTTFSEQTAYVYDSDYSGSVPNASLTDRCYRLPVRAGEGYGVSEYTDNENPGLDWLWPSANIQIGVGYDDLKREIVLVLDAKTQREYQINDPEVWTDREGGYEPGSVIKSEEHQKAHQAAEGEHIPIRHIEHHEYFKSFDRKNFKNAAGYDSEGIPLGMRVDNELYEDEEPIIPTVTTKRIPLRGDIVFQEKVEARNLQLRTIIYGAPYWLTGITPNYETVDKSGVPELRVMSEDGYQENMSSMPLFHVSRGFDELLNLATGSYPSAGPHSAVAGPDGREFSALSFPDGSPGPFANTPEGTVSGDFTARMWVNSIALVDLPVEVLLIEALSMEIRNVSGQYHLYIDHSYQTFSVPLNFSGHAWALLVLTRSGSTLTVYENKDAIAEFTVVHPVDMGLTVYIAPNGGPIEVFDMCVLPRAINADDIEYYYDDVIKGGEQVLPPF